MERRDFIKKMGTGSLAMALSDGSGLSWGANRRRPNVLMIVVDDLGYGEVGCYGCKDIPTPHMDSIAANGIRFTDGYVSAPVCCPSRAGYMTGRYQTRFGHEFNAIGIQNNKEGIGLPTDETTIADVFQANGHQTGLVGKWHLGGSSPYHPQERGFDTFYGFLHEGHYYVPPPYEDVTSYLRITKMPDGTTAPLQKGRFIFDDHFHYDELPYDLENPIMRGRTPITEEDYLTDALTHEAISFIEKNQNTPFFLNLSYNSPHSPLQAPNSYMEKFKHIEDIHRRVFAGMVSNLDDNIGKVLQKLKDLNLLEDTLIIFFSDNGGPTKELTSSNKPLRGDKGKLFEGGIRVPFMIQWTNHLPAGKVYHKPVIALDAMPTALAAAGLSNAIPSNLDGVNLLPYLQKKNDNQPHDTLYWRYGNNIALRQGNWKLVRQSVKWGEEGDFQLYNLANDISESNNLIDKKPHIADRLRKKLKQINQEMREALWRGEWNPSRENKPLELVDQ